MQPPDHATLERYIRLVTELLAPGPAPDLRDGEATAVRIEHGLVLPMALAGATDGQVVRAVARLLEVTPSAAAGERRVGDAAGHRRPAYDGLLVYAWQRAMEQVEDRLSLHRSRAWHGRIREWCVALHADLAAPRTPVGDGVRALSAAAGAEAAGRAWAALALCAAGYGRDVAWVFRELVENQQPGGAFLTAAASDNPETRWYHELVLLHACGSYAVLAGDRPAAEAAERAAAHHAAETQPDHATAQPWGLPAFILSDPARPFADEMLHAVRVRQATGPDAVTQILLADTLLALRQSLAPAST
jgi:hypothetical protein